MSLDLFELGVREDLARPVVTFSAKLVAGKLNM